MPGPRAAQNVQMPHPTPGTDKASKCPAVAEGGEGGGGGLGADGID